MFESLDIKVCLAAPTGKSGKTYVCGGGNAGKNHSQTS